MVQNTRWDIELKGLVNTMKQKENEEKILILFHSLCKNIIFKTKYKINTFSVKNVYSYCL